MGKNKDPKILIVDGNSENLLAMELYFEGKPCEIVTALSGNEALSYALTHDLALVIIDVQMPEMNGYETAELILNNKKTQHLPVILVAAVSKSTQDIINGYKSGAVDYIFKPLDSEILESKADIFLKLFNQQKKLETANNKLIYANKKLETANLKMRAQQEEVLEEERLNVLLNMAGATAHELNQPLMELLGNIELIELCQDEPEKIPGLIDNINKAGHRISGVVKKIQTIRNYEIKSYDRISSIINFDQRVNILYIEDRDEDFLHVEKILASQKNISLMHAKSVKKGLSVISRQADGKIDLIFLDFMLEDGDGFDFLEQSISKGYTIPVVIITEQRNDMISARLIKAGACDYLSKSSLNDESLFRVITNTLEKSRLKNDISRMQNRLVETSANDDLTGLYNRRYFMESLEKEIKRAGRYNESLAVLMIDIDHFKKVNDAYGYPAGDMVLSSIADSFSSCIRQSDIVSRYGGKVFALILTHTDIKKALFVAEKIRCDIENAEFGNFEPALKVTASIGISIHNNKSKPDTLIKQAEDALCFAKENGRNQIKLK